MFWREEQDPSAAPQTLSQWFVEQEAGAGVSSQSQQLLAAPSTTGWWDYSSSAIPRVRMCTFDRKKSCASIPIRD